MSPPPTTSTLFPYTTLFRSVQDLCTRFGKPVWITEIGTYGTGTGLPPTTQQAGQFMIEVLRAMEDRKSTRLNSSHLVISYAVFCLKKKKSKTIVNYIQYRSY